MAIGGLDPKKTAQVQQIGHTIKGEIIIDLKDDVLTMKLTSEDEQGKKMAKKLVDQMGTMLAQQMKIMFAIDGTIRQIGKIE